MIDTDPPETPADILDRAFHDLRNAAERFASAAAACPLHAQDWRGPARDVVADLQQVTQ